MKLKKINAAFILTIGISILVFIYLVFIGYDEIKTIKDILKIVASLLFPIPILFFIRFIIIENFKPENTDAYKLKNQKPATIILLVSVALSLFLLQMFEFLSHQKLEDNLIFAHLLNATAIGGYVFNYMLYNNLKANGLLSGILLSLAVHVFFLSV